MRYLPRPRGQRMRTWATLEAYSLTRPLILERADVTLAPLPPKIGGTNVPPMPRPTALGALTAPTVLRRSPIDERFLPLPLPT